jgi:catechol 2,3-dioxygenase-like lactoylglutathione lyase family enzyme
MSESIEFLSAVLLVSKEPKSLADFYRDVVGLPLEDEEHGETEKHYGCELGDLHFAIHPLANFEGAGSGGFALMTALSDPDGNYIEFTQLYDRWFRYLESRKQKGVDVVSRWKKFKS